MIGRRLTDIPAAALARVLMDAARDGVLVMDAEGVVVEASATFCTLLGYSRDEIVGRAPPHPWWVERPAAGARAALHAARRTGGPRGAGAPRRPHGPATVRAVTLGERPGGESAAIVVIVGRASSAAGLPGDDERYRDIVAAMHEGVIVHRPDGVIVSANPSAERLLGTPAADLLGRPLSAWEAVREDGSPLGPATTPPASPPRPASRRTRRSWAFGSPGARCGGSPFTRSRSWGTTGARRPWSPPSRTSPRGGCARASSAVSAGSWSTPATRSACSTPAACAWCR